MTADIRNPERFDRSMRAVHAEAVKQVPPHIQARLRPVAVRAPARRTWAAPLGWSLATAAVAVLALALGMRTPPGPAPADPAAGPALAASPAGPVPFDPYEDPLIAFDEDPDLFIWLASEAQPLAME